MRIIVGVDFRVSSCFNLALNVCALHGGACAEYYRETRPPKTLTNDFVENGFSLQDT